jgi:osmoprotectant transport system substrate-binding protein
MDVIADVVSWLTAPEQWSGPDGIPVRTLQHLYYSLLATAIAAAIALPIGIVIGHTGRGGLVAVNLTNLGRALPTLGIIILVFTLVGFGIVPVLVSLVALAIPPIVTNSYVGIRAVDRDVREAAEGMGMRGRQVLRQVELPVAMPLIMAGIRTSTVQVVATATLAAFVGLGGLGRYLIDGLSQRDLPQVVGGAVLVAGLSLATELVLGRVQALVVSRGLAERGADAAVRAKVEKAAESGTTRSHSPTKGRSFMRRIRLGGAAVAACLALLLAACGGDDALQGGTQPNEQSSVTVGSTNFPEQLILAQMYAAVLDKAGVKVDTRLNLGAREVVFPALEKGEIDLLPEYNGTVLLFLDKAATQVTADEVNTALQPLLDAKGLIALEQSPAEDKDALAVTKQTADKYSLAKISDLKGKASQLVIGGPPELETRPAGIPGLKKVYGIEDFKEFKALDAGGPLTTSALNKGDIDIGRVFTSQGIIAEEGWVVLEEDKPLQPAQNIVPIGRKDAMTDQVTQALNALSVKITTEELTKLNRQVDVDKKDPEQVAKEWLTQQGLL